MKKYYHITPKKNLRSIMRKGLIPQIGERSEKLYEKPAVFLFPSLEDMHNALGNWLGDCFDEDEELVSLEINLPEDFLILDSTVDYEKISVEIIQPKHIKFLKNE